MKPLEYRFSLGMNDEAAQVFCNVRNGDDCSKLIVSLQEDGRAYTFDDDVHAYFLAKKSDGNSLYTECSVENNTIIYEFTEQTAPVSGTVVCQFLLLSGSNRLTTPIFRLEVFDNVSIDPASPQSLPEYTALIDATQDAIDATDDMRDLIEEIEYKLEHGEFKGDQGPQGPQGIQGPQGAQGIQGPTGADGYSPTATVTKSGNTATITITDKNGTTTAEIEDGAESVADVSPLGTSSSLIPSIDTATRGDVLYRVWADATSFEDNDTLGWIIFCGDLDLPTVKQFYFRYNALIMQRVGAVSNGVVSWGEWEEQEATNNATVINDDTVPASVNWQGVIPNTYAGRTGEKGELALYEDYATLWYIADADPQNDYYEWIKVLNTDDLYSLMKLAPLNPTAEQIAAMPSGQLYGDTVHHKGFIKGGLEFYDTNYIDNNYYTKTEIEQKGYLTLGSLPIYDGTVIEEKDVNFYDYDGTVLYSYTAQEVLALTELPEAPTHEGLTFQEWNRSLSDLKTYVTAYGAGDVGATYITDDGVTRLYLEVDDNVSLDYELYVQIANGTLSVKVDGVELGSATGATSGYVNYTIPFTLSSRGNIQVDLKFSGAGGFHIGQGTSRTRIFGWNSGQNNTLVKAVFGSSVTRIESNAFQNYASLNSIVIPDSITSISDYAFYGCVLLNSIVIPDSVTSIGSDAFHGCVLLNSIVIPDSVTSIGSYAFQNCASLNSIVIPDSVTRISSYAFYGCVLLNSIVIPDSVTSIGSDAFHGCVLLNSIVIPDSVTSIGSYAFSGCYLLLTFDLSEYTDPNALPTFSNSNFLDNTPTDQIIYVANQEMLAAFSSAANMSIYADRLRIKEATS